MRPITTEETEPRPEWPAPLMEDEDRLVFQLRNYEGTNGITITLQEIWLRDKATGEEILLLGLDDIYEEFVPRFSKQINARYFVYCYLVPETCNVGDFEIYDLKKLRTVEIERPEWVYIDRIDRRRIYLKTVNEYGEDDVIINTYTIDIAALDGDGPIVPKEVR